MLLIKGSREFHPKGHHEGSTIEMKFKGDFKSVLDLPQDVLNTIQTLKAAGWEFEEYSNADF